MIKWIAVLAVAGWAGAAQAIPMSALFTGSEMTVGNMQFSDWTLLNNNGGGTPINLADIEVIGDAGDPLNPGIIFLVSNSALSVADGSLILNFAFKVTLFDPTLRINGNTLALNNGTVSGDGFISIDETVCTSAFCFPSSPDELAFKNVFQNAVGGDLLDFQNFAPQEQIWVDKSLIVDGLNGDAGLIQFSQYFSQEQVQVPVPAPSTLTLLGIGLFGMNLARRRRKA